MISIKIIDYFKYTYSNRNIQLKYKQTISHSFVFNRVLKQYNSIGCMSTLLLSAILITKLMIYLILLSYITLESLNIYIKAMYWYQNKLIYHFFFMIEFEYLIY